MTTLLHFACGLSVSLLAVAYLLYVDEKRHRVFRLVRPVALPRSGLAGWTFVFAPGLALAAMGQTSAFLAWCGAVTVVSWLIVSRTPAQADES